MNYNGKRVAVIGAGRSGAAAALLLVGLGSIVSLLDNKTSTQLNSKVEMLRGLGVEVYLGLEAHSDIDCSIYDLAVLSPGVDPRLPIVQAFIIKLVPVIAEIELAYTCCAKPVIGITGTNGKTTTTELVAAMLAASGVHTVTGGNIGKPFSEIIYEGADSYDVVTLEVSSFQLERIRKFKPAISVWLNLAPDHLDRYTDVDDYRAAKLRIFENQTAENFAIVNFRDNLPNLSAQRITFSAYELGGDLDLREDVIHYKGLPVLDQMQTRLRGKHNAENLMAAVGVGVAHGLSREQMQKGLCAYEPAPHRLELVRTLNGVSFINDSKATNLDALEKALDAFGEKKPIILIAGGKNKGFGFDSLRSLVSRRARWAILIGEMAPRIFEQWQDALPCEMAASLEHAVKIAWSIARPNEVVLFSPGTSSFDMFKSYVERGEQFKLIVSELF